MFQMKRYIIQITTESHIIGTSISLVQQQISFLLNDHEYVLNTNKIIARIWFFGGRYKWYIICGHDNGLWTFNLAGT